MSITHIKFLDIKAFNDDIAIGFFPGDDIIIEEKLDGANASIQYIPEEDRVAAFSHNYELSSGNDLRGFYGWVRSLDKEMIKDTLGSGLKLFGEWLVPHTVVYPEECYNKFYCFDVLDIGSGQYLPPHRVMEIANKLGIAFVPVFYSGKFTGWQDVTKYVGQTKMGGSEGEGVVVKNISNLDRSRYKAEPYTKIVSDRFKEVHRNAKPEAAVPKPQLSGEIEEAMTIITRARVEKLINKMVDEGLLPYEWNTSHMRIIMKNLPKRIYEDCMKEEPETVGSISNFGAVIPKAVTYIVRSILLERIK
ncbi:MAG: RNA ligase family protein [Oscillospiraceae bacterium]|nr:RNA ligase family protein [Oscillospiraceae bacterium]